MSTTVKTVLIAMLCFIVALVVVLPFTIYHIIDNRNKEIEQYRAEETGRLEQSLRDYVEIAYATIDTHYQNAVNKEYLEKYYGHRLANVLDIAETILKSKAETVEKGDLTLSEAQAQAAAEIKKFRYDNGAGYVWITDTTKPYPKMIMHPIAPSLEGEEMDEPIHNRPIGKDREERNLYQAVVEICQQHGKCVVDYLEDKRTKDGVILKDALKLAYVKIFPEWNWAIGTAIYVDDAIIDAMEKSQNDIRKLRYDNGMGYFWISNADKSNLRMIVHPKDAALEGQILEGEFKKRHESFVDSVVNSHKHDSDKHNGGGFHTKVVDGLTQKFYVKWHQPFGWIVGAGVLDNIEKAVADKTERVGQEIQTLILKLVTISIVIVLLMSVFVYLLNQYIPYAEIIKQQSAAKMGKNTAVNQPMPGVTQTQNKAMLPTDECIKMIQEITKTLIAEQSKLLATAIPKAAQMAKASPQYEEKASEMAQEYEVPDEVKQLANKTYQTIEEVKKRVGANQPPSEAVNTVEIAKFNTVMGNLNKMVGDQTKGLKT